MRSQTKRRRGLALCSLKEQTLLLKRRGGTGQEGGGINGNLLTFKGLRNNSGTHRTILGPDGTET